MSVINIPNNYESYVSSPPANPNVSRRLLYLSRIPSEVSLRATRSRESSTAADREIKITVVKTRRENASDTTMSLTSLCVAKMRPNGGRDTARTEPRKRAITMATLTAQTVEIKWERRTGTTWVTGRNASETR